jgi:hypothetical protein
MASNPLFIIPDFFFIFPMNFAMATLGLKEFRKKFAQLAVSDSQQSRPFSLLSERNFPISFKPKVAIVEFFWKMQRKTWYSILGVDVMPLSLKNLLLSSSFCKV